ncbi:MAG TPA: PP2C family protein-serine/threonine phosphatase [Terriglobales bacterium]|nr:PP2C family protein-serine/threonine phosphatase [Terriglobales bacterium]
MVPQFAPGFDIAGANGSACETGNRFFDFVPMPDGCLGIGLGNVRGQGLEAAVARALTRASLCSFATMGLDVGEVLTRVNQVLSQSEGPCCVDMLLLRLHPLGRFFAFAGAGPMPGFLLGATGNVERVLDGTRSPLGALRKAKFFSSEEIAIPTEGIVLLVTDGLRRAGIADGSEMGAERALAYVSTHLQDHARQLVEGLCRTAGWDDEIASVVVKADPEPDIREDAVSEQDAEAA